MLWGLLLVHFWQVSSSHLPEGQYRTDAGTTGAWQSLVSHSCALEHAAACQRRGVVHSLLCGRYCVLTSVEPVKAETQLLMQLNYAANYQHNCSRRSLLPAVLTD